MISVDDDSGVDRLLEAAYAKYKLEVSAHAKLQLEFNQMQRVLWIVLTTHCGGEALVTYRTLEEMSSGATIDVTRDYDRGLFTFTAKVK
jgi:hypothetical protein